MKDVRSVKMYMNAIYILTIDISADMTTFIYNKTALARINGNALSKLVSELLLDHSNIRVLDPEKNTYEVMGEDDFDEIFCQYLAGMLNLCAEVIRLNFSGFSKMRAPSLEALSKCAGRAARTVRRVRQRQSNEP